MGSVISWLGANWQTLLLSLLAIDAALIPLFPNAGILKTIQTYLTDAKNV